METKHNQIPKHKTAIIHHPLCLKHGDLPMDNPILRSKRRNEERENADRLNVLLQPPFGVLLNDYFLKNCLYVNDSPKAELFDILRVHDYNYVNTIKSISDSIKERGLNELKHLGKFCLNLF